MQTLREVRDTLLTISHPERVLRLADDYLQRFESLGDQFVLPKEHAFVAPILEHYVGDLSGWLKFVHNVKSNLEPRTVEALAVQDFYKTLQVRWIQRRTRAILDVAVDLATRKGLIGPTWEDKQRYAKRCIQSWKLRRETLLKSVRAESKTGRVSTDVRSELVRQFWDELAVEVNNGEIPKP